MSSYLRKKVLNQFKSLLRTSQFVFEGDERAISMFRIQANENFRKNKDVSDESEIEKLIKLAKDVETELKLNVVQAVESEPGVYKVRVTEHTPLLDNVMFDLNAEIKPSKGKNCCSEGVK